MRCISLRMATMLVTALAVPSTIQAGTPLRVGSAPPTSFVDVPTETIDQQAAQEITLSGLVTDAATQQPLSGAQVTVVGTELGGLTDEEGRYRIAGVPAGAHAVRVNMIGYAQHEQTLQFAAGQSVTVDVQLEAQAIELEGIVAVGYGTRRRETLTGSVSAVSGEIIETAPAVNTSNSIGGRLPGIVSSTSSGEPGNDGSSLRIRGNQTLNDNNPLIVVDGVPDRAGGLSRINPQDIESISVLKDASAAIYGARAANGVILVTTRRGAIGQPQIRVDVNQGFNQPTRVPEMADAATYVTMLNEIEMYAGRDPIYTDEEIQNYRDGADPWLYPDTDWFAEALKSASPQTSAHASLTGGTERIRYYLSLGGLTEDGYYHNSATQYTQYNFRSNIDAQVTDNFGLRFDFTGRREDRDSPTQSAEATFRMLMRGKPHLPAYWPDGTPGPDIEYGQNPVVTGTDVTGYDNDVRYYLQGNIGLDWAIPGVDGLMLRGNVAYDKVFRTRSRWEKPWTLYTWDYETRDENGDPVLVPGQRGFSEPSLLRRQADTQDVLANLVGEYRTALGDHSLSFLVGVERQQTDSTYFDAFRRYFISDEIDELFAGGDAELNNNGSSDHGGRQNFFSRVNWDYRGKYLLELIGRYDGSYIFAEGRRYGFFPAVSAGWRIADEPFFRDNVDIIDDLKLRASWGRTGNDRVDPWQYLATYGFGSGYVVGVDRDVNSLYQTRVPNPEVTWEVANQFNVGVDGALLGGRLSFVLDYFNDVRSDILHYRNASVPESSGLTLPRENIGEVATRGFDGSVTWNESPSDDFSYGVSLSGGYAKNEIRFWDEPPGAPEWQRSTGSPMDTGLYYRAIGIFRDEEQVAGYPHWSGARPGDIIFEDVDGDGEITGNDRVRSDRSRIPTLTGGLTLDAGFKQFDFNVFFQGAAGGVQYIETESGDLGNYFAEFANNRWTPDNPNADYPRTSVGSEYWKSQNNTFYLRSTDYLRLKSAQVGYTLPDGLSERLGLRSSRVYLSGFNLLTWDKLDLLDPEAEEERGAYYIQKRVFNAGVSLAF